MYLNNPNIPQNSVKYVALTDKYCKIINNLRELNIGCITVKSSANLPKNVNFHTDMIIHHLGGNKIIVAKGEEDTSSILALHGFEVIEGYNRLGTGYKNECFLNQARINDVIIGNISLFDYRIIEYCNQNNIKIINVNQGYAKCSVCILDSRTVITEDKGIADVLEQNDFDVLLIQPGSVKLDGYRHGFFGGAAGLIDRDKLAITGELRYHSNHREISDFLKQRDIEIIELKKGEIIDIGGIIPLIE